MGKFNISSLFNLRSQRTDLEQQKKDDRKPVSLIIKQARSRAQKDILSWRKALNAAEFHDRPRRYLLYEVYREIILDAHLSGQIELRKRKTLGRRFNIYNSKNEPDEQLTWLLKTPWFGQTMNHMLDARFWGHSLIQIDNVLPLSKDQGGINSISLVPRAHVVPESGLLLKYPTDSAGIPYRSFPDFDGWIIETPETDDLGLLSQAAPYALYKRFAMGTWSEFTELFVTPLRVGKTNTRDLNMMRQMEDMMVKMGSAAWAVIDENESIDFIESSRNDGTAFETLIDLCNNEMSKLINGAVVGDAGNGGSRSKEEVGERMGNEIHESDLEYLEQIINKNLFPILIKHGYPLEGCTFAWEDQRDIKGLWDMTHQAMTHYEIDEDWIKETFGIQITGKRELPSQLSDGFFD